MAMLPNICTVLALTLGFALPRQAMCNEVIWLDSKRVEALARNTRFPETNASVSRNGAGTELYLGAYSYRNDETAVEVLSAAGHEVRRVHGGGPVFADDGTLICSITNHTLVFSVGETIPFTAFSRFGFSPGGALFFYSRTLTNGAAVFRSSNPSRSLFELPEGFMPQKLFFRAGLVFVFGHKFKPGNSKTSAAGLAYSLDGKRASLQREINLSRFAGVTDMDPGSGLLLVEGKGELLRRWGLFDPKRDKYTPRGWAQGSGLFLEKQLIKSLERRCEESTD